MQHLFSSPGLAALAEALRHTPLLAFDFDGTLAPIAPRPDAVHVAPAIGWRLSRLAARMPVAIITGRRLEDARARLGIDGLDIIGNHGAQDVDDPSGCARHARALDSLRALLADAAAALDAAQVFVEDKEQSIALHYRLARNRQAAAELAWRLCLDAAPAVRSFGGKEVVNAIGAQAPDKADAVHALARRHGTTHVIFAGDDVNDEPVFVSAPPTWLTIRIGRDDPASKARYYLGAQGEMEALLHRMLEASGSGP